MMSPNKLAAACGLCMVLLALELPSTTAMGGPPEDAQEYKTQYTETYDDSGDAYRGEMEGEEGKKVKHGVGRYSFADGTYYDGQWKNNMKHGLGKYTYPQGGEYDGEWEDDKQNGYGTYTW